jgi:sulfhydrogenase subunit gamma (sulfur reductase)
MVSLFPVGEALFSITSTPTRKGFMEFSIKETGMVTRALHEINPGTKIGVRGPYGNGFPTDF